MSPPGFVRDLIPRGQRGVAETTGTFAQAKDQARVVGSGLLTFRGGLAVNIREALSEIDPAGATGRQQACRCCRRSHALVRRVRGRSAERRLDHARVELE